MRKYDMNDIENDIPQNAVSVYGSDSTMDEFPILKAFQEYINAEQAKARKRITALAVFFGVLLIAILAIFMTLLVKSYNDNQHLNDRLVDFMQKERERSDKEHSERERAAAEAAARPSRDSAAVIELTKKIETLQEKIYNTQRKADEAERALVEKEKLMAEKDKQAAEALKKAIEDAKPKGPTPEEQEIARLKSLLAAEKRKQAAAVEKERRRQAELEEYRRKHYPQHYQRQTTPSRPSRTLTIGNLDTSALPRYDEDYDDLADEYTAISYYDDEDEAPATPAKKKSVSPSKPKPAAKAPAKTAPKAEPEEKFSIPVEVKKSDISVWDIPEY